MLHTISTFSEKQIGTKRIRYSYACLTDKQNYLHHWIKMRDFSRQSFPSPEERQEALAAYIFEKIVQLPIDRGDTVSIIPDSWFIFQHVAVATLHRKFREDVRVSVLREWMPYREINLLPL